ncbi:MAG: MBL fold metallo-hydrolase [Planctomycetes bacterium]|nr:MBL fold metallo-hydrolase [Planctomycetota bacterium]
MQIKLTFLGAVHGVTGSRFLVEADGTKVLIDCGMYQERKLRERNWARFPVPPASINAVLLTHAHLDHCGLLPKLISDGFDGKIYCTNATAEISQIIVLDSAHLQEEDAAYKIKRHQREGRTSPREVRPLYTTEDARKCASHFAPVPYRRAVNVAEGMTATFYDAGHVLGSSMITLRIDRDGEQRTILFSGDVGRPDRPIIEDPSAIDHADYVLIESTYGDRVHDRVEEVKGKLGQVIRDAVEAGGNIIVPSFALERSQELLYHLNDLLRDKQIPELMVFLDSPMAIRITEVFKHHPEMYDAEMADHLARRDSPFDFPGLHMTQTTNESKAINRIRGTVIVIAGSGMCTGGRIKHHLANNITEKDNTILFVGYQAAGTLGRTIAEGAEEVRIFGRTLPVRARIARIHGFSAHADKVELLKWLESLGEAPRRVFIVHGETSSSRHFGEFLRKKTGWDVTVPAYKDEVLLD